ncbi:S-layer homology domain-containing protein [Acetohalobium arabaticum]|uniref:S-layer domain protein n=1 Tax=Acetohalobium arabaticum (strain ATCC 49924 / DSM 5501 / Z-7288) TaxID=574087 RepID=D9QU91_ACEAZ|nr:S-layer homology domain-containing protein [Acetohalobium arabaticum]ADL11884.1 S-layer domain protein [Acetohalobium arabaticum DSM 5501]
MQKKIISIILSAILIVAVSLPIMANNYATDIEGHWANTHITELLADNILSTYYDGQFKPQQPITRGEFAVGLAKGLDLDVVSVTNLTDIQSHPAKGYIAALVHQEIITGYPDNTFRPERQISRAELVTMLMRALELNKTETEINLKGINYDDIPAEDYWANNFINLASRLEIIDGYPDGSFRPNNKVTRAEAAKMLNQTLKLRVIDGSLKAAYPLSNKIRVQKQDGSEIIIDVANNALVGRNNRLVDLDSLMTDDSLHLIVNEFNKIKYLKAYGMVTTDDIATEVSDLTGGIFNPDEVKDLSQGDLKVIESKAKEQVSEITNGFVTPNDLDLIANGKYGLLKPKMRLGIEMELINQGLTYEEAKAILDTDWNALEDFGKTRLVEAVAIQAGLPVDVTDALLEQNWTRLRRLAEIELIQRATAEVLTSDLLS